MTDRDVGAERLTRVPSSEDSDLLEYRNFVEAASRRGEMIFNRSPAHAGVIVERLFRESKASVLLLTGVLDQAVYGTKAVVQAAVEFIKRADTKVTVLHEGEVSEAHPLLAALRAAAGAANQVVVKRVPDAVAATYPYHFAVGDGQHFRFEKSKATCEAVAQFHNVRGGTQLEKDFRRLFEAVP